MKYITKNNCFFNNHKHLNGWFNQRLQFCHHLPTLISFQPCITLFNLWPIEYVFLNRFGMTWGWVKGDRIFIFAWTTPLSTWGVRFFWPVRTFGATLSISQFACSSVLLLGVWSKGSDWRDHFNSKSERSLPFYHIFTIALQHICNTMWINLTLKHSFCSNIMLNLLRHC